MNFTGVIVIIFVFECFQPSTQVLRNKGEFRCAFPCSRRNRTIVRVVGNKGDTLSFNGSAPQQFPSDRKITDTICWERSGPFYSLRGFNGSHFLYQCTKDTMYDTTRDVAVFYDSKWKYFEKDPTICDICDGMLDVVSIVRDITVASRVVNLPEVGCNIPSLCPKRREWQIRCTGCEPSEANDDGLCCL